MKQPSVSTTFSLGNHMITDCPAGQKHLNKILNGAAWKLSFFFKKMRNIPDTFCCICPYLLCHNKIYKASQRFPSRECLALSI